MEDNSLKNEFDVLKLFGILTLTVLLANSEDDQLMIFFSFYTVNRI